MCPPAYFEVSYSINAWMDPDRPVDRDRAVAQWQRLVDAFLELSHKVDLVDPVPGLPDMVFAANAATVVAGRVLAARFRNQERAPEVPAYLEWFRTHGYPAARPASMINEGEGDHLVTRDRILAGRGFRSAPGAHVEVAQFFDRPVVALDLVDERFYHLDTAMAVLDEQAGEIMYHPEAFSPASRAVLAELYPDAIRASAADAAVLGLNAVSDGRNVVLPATATGLVAQLRERGFQPVGLDLSELLKAGGGVKCCTLELHDA
ncbi:MAG: amidinotransferase [Micromonosporaceae bacterium]|nr:amidinotransferase [Micromonosporaceae bacterium]